MFLELYMHTKDPRYENDAKKILRWISEQEVHEGNGVTWPIMLDIEGGNNTHQATGIEEGNAGIGWVALQAYNITNDKSYLTMATQAGEWLLREAIKYPNGIAWNEYLNPPSNLTHNSLDNGGPGIGWFLFDLYKITGSTKYLNAVVSDIAYLQANAHITNNSAYWYENISVQDNKVTQYIYKDPSWHWGSAGIAAFLSRVAGWGTDMPGEEAGL